MRFPDCKCTEVSERPEGRTQDKHLKNHAFVPNDSQHLLSMQTETKLNLPAYFEPLTQHAETWVGIVWGLLFLFWFFAFILIPFFLWGIYSQSHKQTALLKSILETLKRRP